MENIEEPSYNGSAIYDSPAGRVIRKVNYTPLTELEYEGLRRTSTLRCLGPKAKKNPCDPASKSFRGNIEFNVSRDIIVPYSNDCWVGLLKLSEAFKTVTFEH